MAMRAMWHQLLDAKRQAELNRLTVRAARRCARDFAHAVDHIPEHDPSKDLYRQRVQLWKSTFWDCAAYRDELHRTIWELESKVATLEQQCTELGVTPNTRVPF